MYYTTLSQDLIAYEYIRYLLTLCALTDYLKSERVLILSMFQPSFMSLDVSEYQ